MLAELEGGKSLVILFRKWRGFFLLVVVNVHNGCGITIGFCGIDVFVTQFLSKKCSKWAQKRQSSLISRPSVRGFLNAKNLWILDNRCTVHFYNIWPESGTVSVKARLNYLESSDWAAPLCKQQIHTDTKGKSTFWLFLINENSVSELS